MNALSLLRKTEYIGAKEFRLHLNEILRHPKGPYRVMLHNQPRLAILPDEQFILLLEILEELRSSGLLKQITRQLQQESKQQHPWFWMEAWQKTEKEVDNDIRARRLKRSHNAKTLLKELNR